MIDIGRDLAGLDMANSAEFDPATPHPVIHLMEDQKYIDMMGGTMRLGAWPCRVKPETLAYQCYGTDEVSERHRHRYEINNEYRAAFEAALSH